ncbi:MAG: AbrB/MazE/SpoVT family DNA-binding domain-containing protein [Gemmatimonadota bacterium]|nr:AbrB/MazE/SpoVT family DNA-binding domain-containing protein [Gemmatimonadota bacterium]
MRVSERGQITIPKRLRDRFGMRHNVEVEIVPADGGLLIRKRSVDHPVDRVYGVLERDAGELPASTDDYLEQIRGR